MPAMGALKPAATPPAAPAPSNIRWRSTERFERDDAQRDAATPSSTAGPSGPREFPVPRVATAARVLPRVLDVKVVQQACNSMSKRHVATSSYPFATQGCRYNKFRKVTTRATSGIAQLALARAFLTLASSHRNVHLPDSIFREIFYLLTLSWNIPT